MTPIGLRFSVRTGLPSTSGEPTPTSTPKLGSRSRVRSTSRSTINEHFASGWSAGIGGYIYDQVTGDSSPRGLLGPFEGRVVAVGPLVGYTFKIMGIIPVNLNARWFHEFDVQKRVTGDSVFGTISLPLVNLPPAVTGKY